MGSTVDVNIEQARQRLIQATQMEREYPDEAQKCWAALNAARQPKTDYDNAVKTVKYLETAVKRTKAALERSSKIINAYDETKNKAEKAT